MPEKKPVICVTIDDETIVEEPAPAVKQETEAKTSQVSYKLNKALLACDSTSLVSPPKFLLPPSYKSIVRDVPFITLGTFTK